MFVERIHYKRMTPGARRWEGRDVQLTALLEEGEDPVKAGHALEDAARKILGEPTREQEAAGKVLDNADRPHYALRDLLSRSAGDASRAASHRTNAARYTAQSADYAAQGAEGGANERARWAKEEEEAAARLDAEQPKNAKEALRLTEEIARVEADPAVILARTLLGRKPPTPWKASPTAPAEEADEFDPSLPDGDEPIPFVPTVIGGAA